MQDREKSQEASAERVRRVARVLWVTLALNWFVAFLKIVLGLLTQCTAVLADGFHSLSDGTSNVICLIGIQISGHPADDDHPYGHEKYETLASIFIAGFLLLVSFGIFQHAIADFFHPRDPQAPLLSFVLMGVTFLVNVFVVWYERKNGKELKSDILISDSWHTLTDIFVTLGVLAAMIGIRLHWTILDPIFSILIAALIGWVGFEILKKSSDVLCDKAVLSPVQVEQVVRRTPGVEGCHEIRSRGKSYGVYVDLHVLVDPRMSVADSHRLANIIEHDIKEEFPGVRDVVVHIEPTTHDHKELGLGS